MASAKLWMKLFAMGCALSMNLAVNCNWKTQYEFQGRCCDACPSGEYPKILCTNSSPSVCETCPAENTHSTRCSCGAETLCIDSECSDCLTSPRCQQGEELRRKGLYKFNYVCEPCPNNTYSDAEDSMCEPITQCKKIGLSELFPGNRTHNARCGCYGQCLLSDCHQLNLNIKRTNLAISILVSLVLLINLALVIHLHLRRNAERRKKKKYCLKTHSVLLLANECGCKLSKEESGEKANADGSSETNTTLYEE